MRPSQILAIDTVGMQAEPECQERLIWFYRDLVGLNFVERPGNLEFLLFSSARRELRIDLIQHPLVEKVRRRALLSVQSLDQVAEVLEYERMPHQPISGISRTDRRITLLDPAQNRVELKQEWRRDVFSGPGGSESDSGLIGPKSADGKFPEKGADKTL